MSAKVIIESCRSVYSIYWRILSKLSQIQGIINKTDKLGCQSKLIFSKAVFHLPLETIVHQLSIVWLVLTSTIYLNWGTLPKATLFTRTSTLETSVLAFLYVGWSLLPVLESSTYSGWEIKELEYSQTFVLAQFKMQHYHLP